MVEEKGGGGVELPPTLRECSTADAQCCRRSGRHTREQRLRPNNRKLPLEVIIIFICFLINNKTNIFRGDSSDKTAKKRLRKVTHTLMCDSEWG